MTTTNVILILQDDEANAKQKAIQKRIEKVNNVDHFKKQISQHYSLLKKQNDDMWKLILKISETNFYIMSLCKKFPNEIPDDITPKELTTELIFLQQAANTVSFMYDDYTKQQEAIKPQFDIDLTESDAIQIPQKA